MSQSGGPESTSNQPAAMCHHTKGDALIGTLEGHISHGGRPRPTKAEKIRRYSVQSSVLKWRVGGTSGGDRSCETTGRHVPGGGFRETPDRKATQITCHCDAKDAPC